MTKTIVQTGFSISPSIFDTTGVENPFYETTSQGNSLIEQMKNSTIIINEVVIIENLQELENPTE